MCLLLWQTELVVVKERNHELERDNLELNAVRAHDQSARRGGKQVTTTACRRGPSLPTIADCTLFTTQVREERDELRIQNTELITLTKEQFKQLKER